MTQHTQDNDTISIQLLHQWQAGDQNALPELWTRQEPKLAQLIDRVAKTITGSWSVRDDLPGKVYQRIRANQQQEPLRDLDAFFRLVEAHARFQKRDALKAIKKEKDRYSPASLDDLSFDADTTLTLNDLDSGQESKRGPCHQISPNQEVEVLDLLRQLIHHPDETNAWPLSTWERLAEIPTRGRAHSQQVLREHLGDMLRRDGLNLTWEYRRLFYEALPYVPELWDQLRTSYPLGGVHARRLRMILEFGLRHEAVPDEETAAGTASPAFNPASADIQVQRFRDLLRDGKIMPARFKHFQLMWLWVKSQVDRRMERDEASPTRLHQQIEAWRNQLTRWKVSMEQILTLDAWFDHLKQTNPTGYQTLTLLLEGEGVEEIARKTQRSYNEANYEIAKLRKIMAAHFGFDEKFVISTRKNRRSTDDIVEGPGEPGHGATVEAVGMGAAEDRSTPE